MSASSQDPRQTPTVPLPASASGPGCRFCGIDHAPGSPECPSAQVGKTVAGKYLVRRLLGVGGMGAVYEAEHLTLRRNVAIKRLHGRTSLDPEAVARFHREAQRLAALEHPGIVRVADLGRDEEGSAYIEMELLCGRSVADVVAAGAVPIELAVRIALGALEALEAAHAAGIVHRDLKPENLFLVDAAEGARVKILDFGISKQVEPGTAASITRTGASFGTPLYMSPEQLADSKSVDARSDIWAMGATLYELLTGRPAAWGNSAFEVISRIALGNVERRPRQVRADVPPWLDEVVSRTMERLPEHRFPSARAMADALRAGLGDVGRSAAPLPRTLLGQAPIAAVSLPGVTPTVAAAAPSRPDPSGSTQAWQGAHASAVASTTSPVSVQVGADRAPRVAARAAGPRLLSIVGAGCAAVLLGGGGAVALWVSLGPRAEPASTIGSGAASSPAGASTTAAAARCPEGMVRVEAAAPVARAFCLDRTEVSAGAYARCVAATACAPATATVTGVAADEAERSRGWCTGPRADRTDHPVTCVDWAMADTYCRWAGSRLPSDAEWTAAARGRSERRYPWGSWVPAANVVNACGPECALRRRPRRGYLPRPGGDAFPATMPVGSLLAGASESGALDLSGNAAEWVATAESSSRVARGGGWTDDSVEGVQSTSRRVLPATARSVDVGFRCARDLPP